MKRIFIALAVILTVQMADAQVKSAEDAKKAVESAIVASENPKKAVKPATWIKLASAYENAYNSAVGSGWLNANKQDLVFIMGNVKPSSTENVTLAGQQYTKEVYGSMNYYFNPQGLLSAIEITKPVYEDALDQAVAAYLKAEETDLNGKKAKDIDAGMKRVAGYYLDRGISAYTLGDLAAASIFFEKAADTEAAAPESVIDTMAVYNAGFTAWAGKDYERALPFFNRCIEMGYTDDGEVYAKLGDVHMNLADSTAAVTVLEDGFAAFPQCNSIVIGLINYYIGSGDDPNKLFDLLDQAKALDPQNASLYYVEGDIHKKLGNTEAAAAAYKKAAEVNPNYEFSYIGLGILYYDKAVELQDAAAKELDDAKYMELLDEFETTLMSAIEPFETAFNLTKDNQIKVSLAEYLKNIYFRFRDKSPEYAENYEKYNSIVANGL